MARGVARAVVQGAWPLSRRLLATDARGATIAAVTFDGERAAGSQLTTALPPVRAAIARHTSCTASLSRRSAAVFGTLILPSSSVGGVYAITARRHGVEADAARLDGAFKPALRAAQQRHGHLGGVGSAEENAAFWLEASAAATNPALFHSCDSSAALSLSACLTAAALLSLSH